MKNHKYSVTVTHTEDKEGQPVDGASLSFVTANHDELLEIVRRIQGAELFAPDETASFAVGLKLFGEAMLTHREAELFSDIRPHFMAFMKKLKASLQDA